MRLLWRLDGSAVSTRAVSSRPAVQPVPLAASHSLWPAARCESTYCQHRLPVEAGIVV